MSLLHKLPGGEIVGQGLHDLRAGALTVEACLASMASPRLVRCGLLDAASPTVPDAEIALYQLLGLEPGDAYSRYNGLLRRLASFERAIDNFGRSRTGACQQ